jgi:hypothetical protein
MKVIGANILEVGTVAETFDNGERSCGSSVNEYIISTFDLAY